MDLDIIRNNPLKLDTRVNVILHIAMSQIDKTVHTETHPTHKVPELDPTTDCARISTVNVPL